MTETAGTRQAAAPGAKRQTPEEAAITAHLLRKNPALDPERAAAIAREKHATIRVGIVMCLLALLPLGASLVGVIWLTTLAVREEADLPAVYLILLAVLLLLVAYVGFATFWTGANKVSGEGLRNVGKEASPLVRAAVGLTGWSRRIADRASGGQNANGA